MTQKPTYDDANLILRLYEMRREDRTRQARAWFTARCKAKKRIKQVQRFSGSEAGHPSWRNCTVLHTAHTGARVSNR